MATAMFRWQRRMRSCRRTDPAENESTWESRWVNPVSKVLDLLQSPGAVRDRILAEAITRQQHARRCASAQVTRSAADVEVSRVAESWVGTVWMTSLSMLAAMPSGWRGVWPLFVLALLGSATGCANDGELVDRCRYLQTQKTAAKAWEDIDAAKRVVDEWLTLNCEDVLRNAS
jgi:hypothetical protein